MSDPNSAAALILNGGRARRMGGKDKSQIEVGGERIVERQMQVLSQRFEAIAMVGSQLTSTSALPLHLLVDRIGGKGPIDGIAAGLAWSPGAWVFVVASDMPTLSLPLLDALLALRSEACDLVCVAMESRAQPLFALYHRRLLPLLDKRLAHDQLRASDLVKPGGDGIRIQAMPEARARQYDPQLLSFQNLNRPEDVLTSEPLIE